MFLNKLAFKTIRKSDEWKPIEHTEKKQETSFGWSNYPHVFCLSPQQILQKIIEFSLGLCFTVMQSKSSVFPPDGPSELKTYI